MSNAKCAPPPMRDEFFDQAQGDQINAALEAEWEMKHGADWRAHVLKMASDRAGGVIAATGCAPQVGGDGPA